MKEIVNKVKWFLPWQDQEEEAWLEKQSSSGLHLRKVNLFGKYTFDIGEPKEYIYRLDFHSEIKDKDSYLRLYEDAGWEYIGENSWQYFRKVSSDQIVTEIFTDNQSKIKKYERVRSYHGAFLLIYFSVFLVISGSIESFAWLNLLLTLAYIPLLAILGISVFKISNRINELKESVND
jgi:hypothetical protein